MPPSPQLGYNHNIPHRGRLYHVQTEDSGAERAHIFTHIFYDGTIIGSNKVKYDPHAEVSQFDAYVIDLMQQSHKSMIRELRRGAFDDKIVAYIGEHPNQAIPTDADKGEAAGDSSPASANPTDRESAGDASLSDGVPTPADDPMEQTLLDERVHGVVEGRSAIPSSRSQPPAVPPRFAKAKRKRAAKGPPPPPRTPVAKGPPLRAANSRPEPDPSLQHPGSRGDVVAPPPMSPSASGGTGPRRLQRRRIGGIGGAGVSVGTKVELAARREIVVGKFASEHQHQLDEEILRLLGEDSSS